jgi:CheY-like chemotaxis protein
MASDTFSKQLPVNPSAKEPRESPAVQILLVSREKSLSELLKTQIESENSKQFFWCSSVDEGLELLKKEKIRIVLLDENSNQEMDGLSVAYELRRRFPVSPEIILLAKNPEKISLHECHQIGITQVLKNPINVDDLLLNIEKISHSGTRFDAIHLDLQTLGRIFGSVKTQKKPDKLYKLEVSNIGRGGFFYKISDNSPLPELGQIVDFKIALSMVPSTEIQGTGIIRWFHSEFGKKGFGVEFLQLPTESEKLLGAFVELFKITPYLPDNTN